MSADTTTMNIDATITLENGMTVPCVMDIHYPEDQGLWVYKFLANSHEMLLEQVMQTLLQNGDLSLLSAMGEVGDE